MPQLNNNSGCTLETCPLSSAAVKYDPTLVGNALYLSFFGFIFIIQVLQLIKYRTWSFSCAMMSGLVLEIAGYLGRVQMHFNPFNPNAFLLYLVCITIGPVFFTAAVYFTLSRIIVHYGLQHSRISPKSITFTFMTSDFIALVLQAVGGALTDTASTKKGSTQGTHIMIGGLGFQVLSLLLFITLAVEFALNVRRDKGAERFLWEPKEHSGINGKNGGSFRKFLFALSLATICILTRSCFRVAELSKGFRSRLANEEIIFMVLEGAMIVFATSTMTIFHPGWIFGAKWADAGWNWKKQHRDDIETVRKSSSQPSSSVV